ncbi:MAG: hypothetical protein GYA16_10315 [Spirochaetes bacterium]|nr:hypothetical protein [Spirochaetota bacterium]
MITGKSIIVSLFLLLQSTAPDFSITLSYHPAPFYYEEWHITIARIGQHTYIETTSPQYARKKRSIPIDEYSSLVEKIVSSGIWNCKDCYSYGNYYMLTITKGNYRHKCNIEYAPQKNFCNNATQIIRLIINTANNYLQ